MPESLMTTMEFELPIGIEVNGKLCRHGVMRRVRNRDIILMNDDIGFRAIKSQDANIEIVQKTDASGETVISVNPVEAFRVAGSTAKMYSILFARTVTKLEDLRPDQINQELFVDSYQDDLLYLVGIYNKLNGDETAGKAETKLPLASGS